MTDTAEARDRARRYRENLQGELDGVAMYEALAELESDEHLAELYRRLAATERNHARMWAGKLAEATASHTGKLRPPPAGPSARARFLIWLARRFGPGLLLSILAVEEQRGQTMYDDQPEAQGTTLPADERSHARVLQTLVESDSGGLSGSGIARFEGRHSSVGGNSLRAAVLGANDGLVSNLALVMGVAGADISNDAVLVAGFAGLLAGAISMALGEWLSVQSSRELYEHQIEVEAVELAEIPEEEREELILIYEAKGLAREEAEALADKILSDPDTALNTLSREELGIDPDELGGSPWRAAGASFLLFTLGAIFPVAPFLFLSGWPGVLTSLVASGLALFAVGAAITLLTGRGILRSGIRQMLLGLLAAAVTFGIGTLMGVAVS